MAVIALASASGSPGVTTTALGLAMLWPRPVLLVEADPTGGSGLLAGYFRGTREYRRLLRDRYKDPKVSADEGAAEPDDSLDNDASNANDGYDDSADVDAVDELGT